MIELFVTIMFCVLALMGGYGFINMMREKHVRRIWELWYDERGVSDIKKPSVDEKSADEH